MAVMGRVKSRFLRAMVETVQQETGGRALVRLRNGLPPYLLRLLSRDVVGALERDATVNLESGIELLLAIDGVLCGGSGVVTARASATLAARILSHSSGLVVPGDTLATLQHLRAPFEQPFVEAAMHFSVRRTLDGFVLELELEGSPRVTQWLAWAGLGYARAAAMFSGTGSTPLRFHTELLGDGARVVARQSDASTTSTRSAQDSTFGRDERVRAAAARRRGATNAVAEVEQILSRVSSFPSSGARLGEARQPGMVRAASLLPDASSSEPARPASGVRPAQRAPAAIARPRKSAS
jgi:hypothetical protein